MSSELELFPHSKNTNQISDKNKSSRLKDEEESEPIDFRPIAEAWGEDASITDCFVKSNQIGPTGSDVRSDMSNLVDTSTMTFHHTITSCRVCTVH